MGIHLLANSNSCVYETIRHDRDYTIYIWTIGRVNPSKALWYEWNNDRPSNPVPQMPIPQRVAAFTGAFLRTNDPWAAVDMLSQAALGMDENLDLPAFVRLVREEVKSWKFTSKRKLKVLFIFFLSMLKYMGSLKMGAGGKILKIGYTELAKSWVMSRCLPPWKSVAARDAQMGEVFVSDRLYSDYIPTDGHIGLQGLQRKH